MNRESLPLILALLVPIILVVVILLYYFGVDLTIFLRKIPLVYYIIVFPIVFGFIVIIAKWMRRD